MSDNEHCCPCDELIHPPKPDIPAGLSTLPRQLAGFPEFRRAMLREIPTHAPLSEWRAREGDDRGIMLIEMWAYVLDILGFYDERVANETYLTTAMRRPSLRRLVELIGYRPRPGTAASVVLAAIAEGPQPLVLPAGTSFRSGAFDGEPPQVFESTVDTVIEPKRNRWTVAPIRPAASGREILMEPASVNLQKDALALFQWGITAPISDGRVRISTEVLGSFSNSSPALPFITLAINVLPLAISDAIAVSLSNMTIEKQPSLELALPTLAGSSCLPLQKTETARVTDVRSIQGRDGKSYADVWLEPMPKLDRSIDVKQIEVLTPSTSAVPHGFSSGGGISHHHQHTTITLAAEYPQLVVGSPLIVERNSELWAANVRAVQSVLVSLGAGETPPQSPATRITVRPCLPSHWTSGLRVHFDMVEGGRLTSVAKSHVSRDDLDGATLEPPVEPPETESSDELLLHDAEERGERVGGNVVIDPADPLGRGALSIHDDVESFPRPLRTPVSVFGNLVAATRGESVTNEVIGSGDASQTFQSFTLAQKPLTYLADASAPDGRQSTLQLRVNGIAWQEVPSFFGTQAESEVFIVRQNDEEESIVTFGDGVTGARPPTGVDNVVASYRYGVGAAKPPANSITQLARPVEGLRRVLNPVAAGGGRDADQPEDLRDNAPASAMTLGRAVSLLDFEALAYDFGVLNAHASWAWDETGQRAVVKIWIVVDGGDIEDELRSYLIGQSDPNTPLRVCRALPIESELIIDLEVEPRHDSDTVEAEVVRVLTDTKTGLLALQNIPIGCPLFRSRVFADVLAVAGVVSVRQMTLNGRPAPAAITVDEGHFHHFLPKLRVGNIAAGDQLLPTLPALSVATITKAELGRLRSSRRAVMVTED